MKFPAGPIVTTVGVASTAAAAIFFFRPDHSAPVSQKATVESDAAEIPPASEHIRAAPQSSVRSIIVDHGTLSLTLHEQLLGPVLDEISRKGHVSIYSQPAIDAGPATVELREVPLDRGLHELLKDYDVFSYSSAGNLRSVWIYEKNAGATLVPVPPESWASTTDIERRMNAGSPTERIGAVETLVARNGPDAIEVVNRALLDDDPEVRLRALDVGLLALEAIASGTPLDGPRDAETQQLIRRMMGDADADVRAKAAKILESRTVK